MKLPLSRRALRGRGRERMAQWVVSSSSPRRSETSTTSRRVGEALERLARGAVLAILSISGFPAVPSTFLGFPPSRRGERDRWYAAHAARNGTTVLFESPFRIAESLEALARAWGDPPVVLGRELTKLHEEVLRCLLYTS